MLSSIILLTNELDKKINDLSTKNLEYKKRYSQIVKENTQLKTLLTYNDQSMTEQIIELQNNKQTELSQ